MMKETGFETFTVRCEPLRVAMRNFQLICFLFIERNSIYNDNQV